MALTHTTGFTDDGKIFFGFSAPSQDGTPLRATLLMDPHEAKEIAKSLLEACEKSVSGGREIIDLR